MKGLKKHTHNDRRQVIAEMIPLIQYEEVFEALGIELYDKSVDQNHFTQDQQTGVQS